MRIYIDEKGTKRLDILRDRFWLGPVDFISESTSAHSSQEVNMTTLSHVGMHRDKVWGGTVML